MSLLQIDVKWNCLKNNAIIENKTTIEKIIFIMVIRQSIFTHFSIYLCIF